MNKKIIAVAVLMSAFSVSSFANGFSIDNLQPSIRAQINHNNESFNSVSNDFYSGTASHQRTTGGAFFGFNLYKYLGAEVGYTDLGKVSGKSLDSVSDLNVRTYAVPVRFLATYELNNKMAVNGKIGIAYVNMDYSGNGVSESKSSTRETYGVGVVYALNKNAALTADYDRYVFKNSDNDKNQFSVGVKYSF